jgi:hypothetical protein
MPSSTFAIDAVLASRGFTADAVILGNRLRHDRTLDHNGVQPSSSVTLSTAIGPYPAGTTVEAVLIDFAARLTILDSANRSFGVFTASALIAAHFSADAIIKGVPTGSFTVDAILGRAFTANAVIKDGGIANSLTADAFIV